MDVLKPPTEAIEFDETAFVDTLRSAVDAIGVPLSPAQIGQCVTYTRLLLETNAHTNLTRITEPREMAVKHFADSLTVLLAYPSPPGPLSPRAVEKGGASDAKGANASPAGETASSITPPFSTARGERGPGGEGYSSLCDVGTGAGFPGIVLKIARPDIKLTLLDSLQKRLTFLEHVCSSLGFTGRSVCPCPRRRSWA
jgi:16S rRNA (guanine527-N7)-methyltransferase